MARQEFVYCAVDKMGRIQPVKIGNSKIRYFRTPKYLKEAIESRNKYYPNNQWKATKFELVEVVEDV